MGEGSIQISRLIGNFLTGFIIFRILDLTHEVHTVGNHDENHSHVFCKRKQQVSEVFRFDGRALGIEFIDLDQTFNNTRHIFAIFRMDKIQGTQTVFDRFVQHDAQNCGTLHADFFSHNDSCLHILDNRVHAKDISRQIPFGYKLEKVLLYLIAIVLMKCIAGQFLELLI